MLWDHAFFTEKVYQEEEILGMGIEWGMAEMRRKWIIEYYSVTLV
jgi:hypothetical protein